jgi:hypothetical protein
MAVDKLRITVDNHAELWTKPAFSPFFDRVSLLKRDYSPARLFLSLTIHRSIVDKKNLSYPYIWRPEIASPAHTGVIFSSSALIHSIHTPY